METNLEILNQDSTVMELAGNTNHIIEQARSIEIVSDETDAVAREILAAARKTRKRWREIRDFFVKPLKDEANKKDAFFKEQAAPIEEAEKIVERKVLEWNDKQEKAAEAERIRQEKLAEKRQETADKRAAEKGEVAMPVPVPIPMQPTKTVKTAAGTVGITVTRKFRVYDEQAIPRKYLMVDTVKIGKLVRAGLGDLEENGVDRISIPGVEIYAEKSTGVR